MVEEQARVVDREGDYVWVETQRQTSCGSCSVKNGCGTQVLSKVFGNKSAWIRCRNTCQAKIGDQVIIGINEAELLSGSFLLYLLPILTMIAVSGAGVAIAGQWWPQGTDLLAIIGAVIGLLAGLKYSRIISQTDPRKQTHKNSSHGTQNTKYEPVILRKVNPLASAKQVIWNKP